MEGSPVVGRPLAFASEEQRAFHSWSRISSAGHNVLLDALKIFDPKSFDLSNTEDLVIFLRDLCMEGHKPTVLRSKDVYRYRSCTTQPLTMDMLKPANKNFKSMAKKRAKRPLTRRKEVHPSWNTAESSSPRIQGVRPPELLLEHCAMLSTHTASHAVELQQVQRLQPCLRLTNIKGLSGCHTAKLQIHTSWGTEAPGFVPAEQQQPPTLSGIPLQPLQNGGVAPNKAVALLSQKSLSCPLRLDGALIGDSAPVFYTNGRGFPDTQLTFNSWKSHSHHQGGPCPKGMSSLTKTNCKDKNSVKWKVIKVDDSRSVAEALSKAEKILQVDLSPVIQIQPLNHVLGDFRYKKQ